MGKVCDIVITVCMLGLAVSFWVLGGKKIILIQGEVKPLSAEESFAEAEGRYVSYEAAYPVNSYAEARSAGRDETGYVVYDESRQAFLCVLVQAMDTDEFDQLMGELRFLAEYRRESAMEPILVKGQLEPMDEPMINRARSAVKSRMEALEGRETDAPVEAWDTILNDQKDWYVINHKMVDGISTGAVWRCVLASFFSLLIFVCRVLGSLTGEGKKEETVADGSAGMNQFLTRQSGWVKEWCQHNHNRDKTMAYRWLVGSVVFFVALGLLVRVGLKTLLVLHLPLGVLFGEAMLGLCSLSMHARKNWKKVLKGMKKDIQKQIPTPEGQAAYFADYFEAGIERTMEERCKDSLSQVTLGEKYWTMLSGYGSADIVEFDRIDHIETVEQIICVRINKVRSYTYSYLAEIILKGGAKNKERHTYGFDSENVLNSFVQLVKRCTNDGVEVQNMGTRKI